MDKMGTWWLRSIKDPRWNFKKKEVINEFSAEECAFAKFRELKKKLGEPPEDLEWGFQKD